MRSTPALLRTLLLFVSLGLAAPALSSDRWEAKIDLRFVEDSGLLSQIGLISLKIKRNRVSGIFREAAAFPGLEVSVSGKVQRKIRNGAVRQRIRISLRTEEDDAEEIRMTGQLVGSGGKLRYSGQKMIRIVPHYGVAEPDHFVARLHQSDWNFTVLTPLPGESVDTFLDRVEETFRNDSPNYPYRWKVLIPTDDNGFWSQPTVERIRSSGRFRCYCPAPEMPVVSLSPGTRGSGAPGQTHRPGATRGSARRVD